MWIKDGLTNEEFIVFKKIIAFAKTNDDIKAVDRCLCLLQKSKKESQIKHEIKDVDNEVD